MKVAIKRLLDSTESLGRLGSVPINSAVKFRLARVIKQVNGELEPFNTVHKELCERLGTPVVVPLPNGQQGTRYNFADNQKQFDLEFAELTAQEVEIKFDHFTEEIFESLPISAVDIVNLDWLFTDQLNGSEPPASE